MHRLLPRLVHVLHQVGRQFLVITRNHGEGGNQQDVGLVVALGVFQRLEAERGREQGDAVERDALVREIAGDAGGARGSVTLAEEEERRTPALVAREIQPDEFAEGVDVALHAQKFLGQLSVGGAAEAG